MTVRAAYDEGEAARADLAGSPSLFVDPRFPPIDGQDPLDYLRRKCPRPRIALLLDRPDRAAEEAWGRNGYPITLAKPFDGQRVERALTLLSADLPDDEADFEGMTGASPAMRAVYDGIAQVADTDATVLLTGETGVGKERAASAIHRLSRRRFRRFVTIDCAALPEELLEAELFGHEKGAFTGAMRRRTGKFEYADQGTVFLDEIGEISPRVQQRLLRVVEAGQVVRLGANEPVTVDLRLIFATHRDLAAMVKEGSFRADLFYRINTFPLSIPPLRERPDDIPALANRFFTDAALRHDRPVTGITPRGIDWLMEQRWEGNVRELAKRIERGVLLAGKGEVDTNHLAMGEPRATSHEPTPGEATIPYRLMAERVMAAADRRYFTRLLTDVGGNLAKAARIAELDRKTLYARMAAVGLDPTTFRKPS